MNLSYWEYKTWLSNIDFTIVGSGIVGLNCAIQLRSRYPKAKIMVLEKGILPQGASTKNAGFACFGSISEIKADLQAHTQEEVLELVSKRWNGIALLRKTLGDRKIGFRQLGGHELFTDEQADLYEDCVERMAMINGLLRPVFNKAAFRIHGNSFHFHKIRPNYITNDLEAQLNTGQMMAALLHLAHKKGIVLLNSITVKGFADHGNTVSVETDQFNFDTNKLLIATNGFAAQLLNEAVKPARAQVLITKPIEKLHIKGTFHIEEGYYYFRNIDDRILFGGGRNLDFKAEETTVFGETPLIQNRLETILKEMILPNTPFEIEHRWSGIMGMGDQKRPIVKQVSNNVTCGVRLGGMGIAIGSAVGQELADMI